MAAVLWSKVISWDSD